MMRFEPDPIFIDDANNGYRNVEPPRGYRSDPVERTIGRAVENIIATHRSHALIFSRMVVVRNLDRSPPGNCVCLTR